MGDVNVEEIIAEVSGRFPSWEPSASQLGFAKACVNAALARLSAQTSEPATQQPRADVVEVLKKAFISGHNDGWRGNQLRRDAQHVDAEKGWDMLVAHGAVAKWLSTLRTQAPASDDVRADVVEALKWAKAGLQAAYDEMGQGTNHNKKTERSFEAVARAKREVEAALRTQAPASDEVRELLRAYRAFASIAEATHLHEAHSIALDERARIDAALGAKP